MCRFLVSAVGVACAAVLALPPNLPAAGAAQPSGGRGSGDLLAGGTRNLPLTPMRAATRALGARVAGGLPARTVKRFSLLGVTWDDPAQDLHATVRVRSRAVGTGVWSPWQEVETHTEDAPDAAGPADTPGRAPGRARGSTHPLWVGDSDGVEVRVQPEPQERAAVRSARSEAMERSEGTARSARSGRSDRTTRAAVPAPALPAGLRLEMVDPGGEPPADAEGASPGSDVRSGSAGSGDWDSGDWDSGDWDSGDWEDSWGDWADSAHWTAGWAGLTDSAERPDDAGRPESPDAPDEPDVPDAPDVPDWAVLPALTRQQARTQVPGTSFVGARPRIITRAGWGANESLRKAGYSYTKNVKVAFVHHTGTGNGYTCAKAPSVIRSIYRYHVQSSGWRDVGYNFLVDKCGNIYEGRAGGVTKAVLGAHTLGFNSNSMGVAVLGTYSRTNPSAAALKAVAKLTAWKLGLFGADPDGTTQMTSAGNNKYKKGKSVKLRVISGHRDGFVTECPGARLYDRLGAVRDDAAELQGR